MSRNPETRRASFLRRALTAALLFAALPVPAFGFGAVDTQIQFLSAGADHTGGTARARYRLDDDGEQDFNVELEYLAVGSYDLYVGGVFRGSITVGAFGEGEIEFEIPLDPPKPLFDFEVFGETIEVRAGAAVLFSDVFTGSGGGSSGGGSGGSGTGSGSTSSKEKIEIFMVNVGPDWNAKGRVRYEAEKGKTRFDIEVEYLDAGTYDLVVGGAVVGQIVSPGGSSEVELEFRDPPEPGHIPLTFDPLGKSVTVEMGGVVYLSTVMPGSTGATGTKPPSKGGKDCRDVGNKHKGMGDGLEVGLTNVGVMTMAKGKATLVQGPDGSARFEVEIEDMPASVYTLRVGGIDRGTITVGGTGQGEIEFENPLDPPKPLLDFDVKGQLIEILSGSDVLLSEIFPTSVQEALGKFKKEKSSSSSKKLNLYNRGVDLDVTGELEWKRKKPGQESLKIKLKDLPAGFYDVFVDGVLRGDDAIFVKKDHGGGSVSFESTAKPGGKKLLLDFPVVGKTVTVRPDGDTSTVLLETDVE